MTDAERIRIRWAGTIVTATVLRRFANGRIRVEVQTSTGWTPGHRYGHTAKPERFTIDPWQVVTDEVTP